MRLEEKLIRTRNWSFKRAINYLRNKFGLDSDTANTLWELWRETSALLHFVSRGKQEDVVRSIPGLLEEYASKKLGVPTGMAVPPPISFLMEADIEELKKLTTLVDKFIYSMERLLRVWAEAVNLDECVTDYSH